MTAVADDGHGTRSAEIRHLVALPQYFQLTKAILCSLFSEIELISIIYCINLSIV